MTPPLSKPAWAEFMHDLGELLASLPATPVGDLAPRVIVSVPTGRFAYWMLAAGALEREPVLDMVPSDGDRVATWFEKRMRDVVIEEAGRESWRLGPQGTVMKTFPMVPVPEGAPEDRGTGFLPGDYRDNLRQLPGKKNNFHMWFARHCLKPVIIVGTGREHIQRQRAIILEEARHWFSVETAALLDDDSTMTSNVNRILFHPYSVFDAGCDKNNGWIRDVVPRLVITTSWSSRKRMHPRLFQRAPQLILVNRRVISSTEAFTDTADAPELPGLQAKVEALRIPAGVFVRVYGDLVQPDSPAGAKVDDSAEEDYL